MFFPFSLSRHGVFSPRFPILYLRHTCPHRMALFNKAEMPRAIGPHRGFSLRALESSSILPQFSLPTHHIAPSIKLFKPLSHITHLYWDVYVQPREHENNLPSPHLLLILCSSHLQSANTSPLVLLLIVVKRAFCKRFIFAYRCLPHCIPSIFCSQKSPRNVILALLKPIYA